MNDGNLPASSSNPAALREFYERTYARALDIVPLPPDDDFMCGQVLAQLRPLLKTGARVLDLGCNNGNLSLYMARRACEVLGIDLAHNAVETAKKSAEFHRLSNVRFAAMDFLQDWKTSAAFDLVLCSHVIEHVPQDALFARKIFAALRPGGKLVLLAPAPSSSLYRVCRALTGRFKHDEEAGHLRRYSAAALRGVAAGAGFRVERAAHLDGVLRDWFILFRPLRRFNTLWCRPVVRRVFNGADRLCARICCAATVCVIATKPDEPEPRP